MVCGLLEKRTIAQTEQLLEKSLAQFQAKLKVKKMVTRQRREEEALEKYKNPASCHLGDINEYLSLVKSLAVAQKRNDPEWEVLKKAIRQHPVHGCKDRESHLRWGERRLKLEKQVASLKRDISRDTSGIKRIFKNVLSVLEKFEYLTVSDSENILTNKGELLTKIHSEQDLLLGEAIDRNVFSNLKPSELVSLVSGLTYESRIDQDYEYWLPNEVLNERADELLAISHEIIALEDKHDLSFTSEPDFSFANSVFMWANGASLRKVLKIANMSAGDFVRSMKQNIDLLGQISALENSLAQTAKDALKLINRGVIAQEYVLGVDETNHELIEEVH